MKRYFDRLNIETNDSILQKLNIYYDFLTETNNKFNLTAIVDKEQAYDRHFADSMAGADLIEPNSSVCDVGSGAGFPGIPLKILRNDIDVTLVDSLNKRVEFLKELSRKLDLKTEAVHCRAEDFAKNSRESFDVVTARAVAPLNVLLEYLAPLAKVNGRILAYKTDRTERQTALNAENTLGLKYEFCKNYTLWDGSQRCILVYKKVKKTPPAYPRPQNKPRKNPL
ncbi:MAG: 16S rRNA (guanine(527)-N(7))-methyltransferase RsmG [Corallococcus sp.]|nr:16S rRNA (guanine(527)-N(7))-methyltransferase RsmG [Corallococcus sp.]